MVERSEVIFKEVDYDIAAKHLGEALTMEEIKAEGFEEIVYIKKKKERKPKTNKVPNKNKKPDKTSNYDVAMENHNNEKEPNDKDSKTNDKVSNKNRNVDKTSIYDVAKLKNENSNKTSLNINPEDVALDNKEKGTENDFVENVTNNVKEEKDTKDEDDFEPPSRKPTPVEERRMIGKVIEMLIIAGMTNHVYRFNNQIRIQVNGGPIGLSLTGQVADCYMIDWDSKYLKRL